MISAELLHTLRTLPRADKLYLMQFLLSELAQEESDLLKPGWHTPCGLPMMRSRRLTRCWRC